MDIEKVFLIGMISAMFLTVGSAIATLNARVTATSANTIAAAAASKGFDEFGYNYQARVFSGPADGVDRNLDGTVWGDPTYANDHLVMKWSKGWDDARFHGAPWGPDAWEDNEWNGMMVGGSGTTEHAKIIWVGSEGEDSQYWREGGYMIWGQFEVIMDQGMDHGEQYWFAHGIPAGYGPGN